MREPGFNARNFGVSLRRFSGSRKSAIAPSMAMTGSDSAANGFTPPTVKPLSTGLTIHSSAVTANADSALATGRTPTFRRVALSGGSAARS